MNVFTTENPICSEGSESKKWTVARRVGAFGICLFVLLSANVVFVRWLPYPSASNEYAAYLMLPWFSSHDSLTWCWFMPWVLLCAPITLCRRISSALGCCVLAILVLSGFWGKFALHQAFDWGWSAL